MIDVCKKMDRKSLELVKRLIKATRESGTEHAFKLCYDGKRVVASETCVGIACYIPASSFQKLKCPDCTFHIGSFHTHTHPHSNRVMEALE